MDIPQRETLAELAAEETQLKVWYKARGKEFCDALGMWPFDENILILALAKLKTFFGGRWPGFKDDMDRATCDVLSSFLGGQEVDQAELRLAVSQLVQRFNACCDGAARRTQPRPYPWPPRPRNPWLRNPR
jgi:hypothetical protein